jgi:hypothetical protein
VHSLFRYEEVNGQHHAPIPTEYEAAWVLHSARVNVQ